MEEIIRNFIIESYRKASSPYYTANIPTLLSLFRTGYRGSLGSKDPRLFNILSKSFKDLQKVDIAILKAKLDIFL